MKQLEKRPKYQFEIWKEIHSMLKSNKELQQLDSAQKDEENVKILTSLIKLCQTAKVEIEWNKYYKEFGKGQLNDDLLNAFTDNSFDFIILNDGRSTNTPIRDLLGDGNMKVNWKLSIPTAKYKEVSLSPYQLEKYEREKVNVIFIIENSRDPHYYNDLSKMYFPTGKPSVDGFQLYLLHYKDFGRGVTGTYGNIYYKITGEVVKNIGLVQKQNKYKPLTSFINKKEVKEDELER